MPPIVDAQSDTSPPPDAAGAASEPREPGPHRPRIALAHDWLCGMRGGEQVLERIARAAAEIGDISALYVMFNSGHPHTTTLDAIDKRCARLGRLPGALRVRRWLLPLYPLAIADVSRRLARDHEREPIDLLISSSSAAIKGLRPPPGVPHLCYCHSPARYIWSRTADYRGSGLAGRARAASLRLVRPFWRHWDRRTARNVTAFIANSTHIAAEIHRCYRREAQIIHPPIRDEFLPKEPRAQGRGKAPGAATQRRPSQAPSERSATSAKAAGVRRIAEPPPVLAPAAPRRERFWLLVSALEPYKRTDIAIEAARLAGAHLVIAGDGSCRRQLERRAGPLIRFEGRVSDNRLRELYHTAAVLLFPQIEDFGIVCVEAQACGLPVAAARAGGALDIVIDGATGAFATPGDPRSLAEAARRAAAMSPVACRANAARFAEPRFDAAMRSAIAALLDPRKDRRTNPARHDLARQYKA
jgi:glycosyltransferase involved in cell wall biosynthesis